jgi:hypothetical protein
MTAIANAHALASRLWPQPSNAAESALRIVVWSIGERWVAAAVVMDPPPDHAASFLGVTRIGWRLSRLHEESADSADGAVAMLTAQLRAMVAERHLGDGCALAAAANDETVRKGAYR